MDTIRAKLAASLGGDEISIFQKVVSSCPLLFVTAGMMAGIFAQRLFDISNWVWLTLLILGGIAGAGVYFRGRDKRHIVLAVLATGIFLFLGAIRYEHYFAIEPGNIGQCVCDKPIPVAVRGITVTEPRVRDNSGWGFARFSFRDAGSSFYLDVRQVFSKGGWVEASGRMLVSVDQAIFDIRVGDCLEIECMLSGLGEVSNPGQFDFAGYMADHRVAGALRVRGRSGIKVDRLEKRGTVGRLRSFLNEKASALLMMDTSTDAESWGLTQALLLGNRRKIDRRIYRAFEETGLLHLISLSGMHLGILAGAVWFGARAFQRSKRQCAAVVAVFVVLFLLTVPARSATLRAGVIVLFFCASMIIRRQPNAMNTLCLAALVLLMINPTSMFSAGWQLSFASVAGILVFTQRIWGMAKQWRVLSWTEQRSSNFLRQAVGKIVRWWVQLLATGIGAWLGGAGIILYHFYSIVWLGAFWTVLVFPLVVVTLLAGYVKIAVGWLSPTVGFLAAKLSGLSVDIMCILVKWAAELGISELSVGKISWLPIFFYYCGVLIIAGGFWRRFRMGKRAVLGCFVIPVIFAGAVRWESARSDELRLTFLDVGHGQAAIAESGGRAFVFDAGSLYKDDIGIKAVIPFLRWRGIDRIDAVFVSHDDLDHINGIGEIVQLRAVERAYANAFYLGRMDSATKRALKGQLEQAGLELEEMPELLTYENGFSIRRLWPMDSDVGGDFDDNEMSSVILLGFGGKSVLLTADIGKKAMGRISELYPDLKADIVTSPHHGSVKSRDEGFLYQLNAKTVITSCGYSDFKRLKKAGLTGRENHYHTATDGALTITISDEGSIEIESFKSHNP